MSIEDIIRGIIREELGRMTTAEAPTEPAPQAEEPAPAAEEPAEEKQPTLDELRDAITAAVKRTDKATVVAIMKEHGSTKVSDYEGNTASLFEALNDA
jgi:ATP phosphoribosyltransferase